VRAKLRLDIEDIRTANPEIIYVRGSGWGPKGPRAEHGAYDRAAAWATAGVAYKLTPPGGEPAIQPPAFFDLLAGAVTAGAVAVALYKRERTGAPSVVDTSLMNVGMWAMSPDIVTAPYSGGVPLPDRRSAPNPIANWYSTKDGRWLYLVCLQSDRFWADVCRVLGRDDMITDPRFADADGRLNHREECIAELDRAFEGRTLAEWCEAFDGCTLPWAPAISADELRGHPQVAPNNYLPQLTGLDGETFSVVASPMQFNEQSMIPRGPAPELGQHTEEVLLELGLNWDEISNYREGGALG
jgi:formyl-CoA transferase